MWPFLDITVCFGGFHLVFEVKVTWHTTKYGDPYSVFVHLTHPKCTHTHTMNTHMEQWAAFYAAAPGEKLEVRCLAQGHFVVVLKVERELNIHSPHRQFLPARDSNSQPLDYESDSPTIRPRLAASKCLTMPGGAQRFITVWTNNRNQNVLLYGVMFIAD